MDDRQLNFGNSVLHRESRNQTPANVINGREAALFVTPAPEVKQEGGEIEDNMSSRQPQKRPPERGGEGSSSKRQRTDRGAAGGGRSLRQAEGGPTEIIDLDDDAVPDQRQQVDRSPPRAPGQQPARGSRSAASQQRTPASSVDLTNDEEVISFQILDEAVQTMTISAAFQYVKRRMEEVYRRRAPKVLNNDLESYLKVIAAAISSPKSTKAFIMSTYQKTWKKKLQDAVKCRENQYKKAVEVRDDHDWEDDEVKYDKHFVRPKLKLYEAAKKDFQIVEKLIDVLKGI